MANRDEGGWNRDSSRDGRGDWAHDDRMRENRTHDNRRGHIGETGEPGGRRDGREALDLGDRNPSQGFSGGFWGRTGYGTTGQNQYGTDAQTRGGQTQGAQTHAGRGPKGYRRADARIEEEVNEALTRHHDIDATDIEVRVEGGEVTLGGEVPDRHMKRLAEDVAERAGGVRDVHNHIRVRGRTDDR